MGVRGYLIFQLFGKACEPARPSAVSREQRRARRLRIPHTPLLPLSRSGGVGASQSHAKLLHQVPSSVFRSAPSSRCTLPSAVPCSPLLQSRLLARTYAFAHLVHALLASSLRQPLSTSSVLARIQIVFFSQPEPAFSCIHLSTALPSHPLWNLGQWAKGLLN